MPPQQPPLPQPPVQNPEDVYPHLSSDVDLCQCHFPIVQRDENSNLRVHAPTRQGHDLATLSHALAHTITHDRLIPHNMGLALRAWRQYIANWAASPHCPLGPSAPLIRIIDRLFFDGKLPGVRVVWESPEPDRHMEASDRSIQVGSHGVDGRVRKHRLDNERFRYELFIRTDQPIVVENAPESPDPASWFTRTLISACLYAYLDTYSCLRGDHHAPNCGYPDDRPPCGSLVDATGFEAGKSAFENDWYVMVLSWLEPECRRLIGDLNFALEVSVQQRTHPLKPSIIPYVHPELQHRLRQSLEGADRLVVMSKPEDVQPQLRRNIELTYYPEQFGNEEEGEEWDAEWVEEEEH